MSKQPKRRRPSPTQHQQPLPSPHTQSLPTFLPSYLPTLPPSSQLLPFPRLIRLIPPRQISTSSSQQAIPASLQTSRNGSESQNQSNPSRHPHSPGPSIRPVSFRVLVCLCVSECVCRPRWTRIQMLYHLPTTSSPAREAKFILPELRHHFLGQHRSKQPIDVRLDIIKIQHLISNGIHTPNSSHITQPASSYLLGLTSHS